MLTSLVRLRNLVVGLGAACACVALAAVVEARPRHAAFVLDANSGKVLHESAADDTRFPASLTKMMTLYLTFELIEKRRLNYNSKLRISPAAAAAEPSKLNLKVGDQILLIDAVKALITKSANDMAIAVAEHVAGSEASFARMMTERARQLGMSHTTFRNASGLTDPQQITTARDMVTLALRLHDDFPRHYPLFATRAFSYRGITHRNHNALLYSYRGTEGMKTGYTRAAGFNLVTSVRRDGKHVFAAVLGSSSAVARNVQMRNLLDRAFVSASTAHTRRPVAVARAPKQEQPSTWSAKVSQEHTKVASPAPSPSAPLPALELKSQPMPAVRPHRAAAQQQTGNSVARGSSTAASPPPDAANPAASPPAPWPAGISVAKVRRVEVAPRARTSAAASARRQAAPDIPPAGNVRTPPPQAPRANAPQLPAVSESATPAPPAPAPVQRGAAPSTLQQQAQNLSRGRRSAAAAAGSPPVQPAPRTPAPRPNFGLGGPPNPPSPSPPVVTKAKPGREDYHIQIGAYPSAADAERQIALVRQRASALVSGHTPIATPVQKGNRQVYRARFTGFDARSAASACNELRRLSVDCLVMKAE